MFTDLFLVALILSVLVRFWLAHRQIRHVRSHRQAVPARFADVMPLAAHQKAADYTIARVRLRNLESTVEAIFLVCLTLLGGIQWADDGLARLYSGMDVSPLFRGLSLVVAIVIASALIDLPFSIYRQFWLEARFGFNKMTWGLFVGDLVKAVLLAAIIGVPLLALVLGLMDRSGAYWWAYVWLVWLGFQVLMMLFYPIVIAPLFNKFEPLEDQSLRARIDALLTRCGFAAKGVFVMDGSRRSAHGNAYFWGFGAAKRIVFFDTLLARLSASEIEAVLAHELGHFKRHHVLKRLIWSFVTSLAGLALLGWLAQQSWFYEDLGVSPSVATKNAVALILFVYVLPVFTFLLSPVVSLVSRRHEYEADAFAAAQTGPGELIKALVKLYEDNASTLTPDPVHSAFYDSHPPATLRIAHLDLGTA
ncbi:MAG: M48 family metallopeptidase [Burkholderiaceae bacterium]|jgi:STE24 endopeptidase